MKAKKQLRARASTWSGERWQVQGLGGMEKMSLRWRWLLLIISMKKNLAFGGQVSDSSGAFHVARPDYVPTKMACFCSQEMDRWIIAEKYAPAMTVIELNVVHCTHLSDWHYFVAHLSTAAEFYFYPNVFPVKCLTFLLIRYHFLAADLKKIEFFCFRCGHLHETLEPRFENENWRVHKLDGCRKVENFPLKFFRFPTNVAVIFLVLVVNVFKLKWRIN